MSISLNNHEDRIAALEKKINQSGSTIIESGHDGSIWWKKYDDGCIEQGGLFRDGWNQNNRIALKIPYSDTNYSVFTTPNEVGWGFVAGAWSKAPDAFIMGSW